MRILKPIVFLFFIVSPKLIKAQQAVVKWHENRALTWADFKGRPEEGSGAVTYWGTGYTYNCVYTDCDFLITFNISNEFYTGSSWVWRNQTTDYLLGHEQLHFDINELYTRKLAAALHSATYTSNFKAEIEEIYNKNRSECGIIESKYDAETNHAANRNMQYRWELFINLQLRALPRNY